MKYEDALKLVLQGKYAEADELIVEALEKQIPKKPLRMKCMILCPNCKGSCITLINHVPTEQSFLKLSHCIDCGQRIDWSDEE